MHGGGVFPYNAIVAVVIISLAISILLGLPRGSEGGRWQGHGGDSFVQPDGGYDAGQQDGTRVVGLRGETERGGQMPAKGRRLGRWVDVEDGVLLGRRE